MENICTKQGEQFMWKGVFVDESIKIEFEEDGTENGIIESIMDNVDLVKFGLAGNGFFSYFDTQTGNFNLFGDHLQLVLLINGTDIMATKETRNKIIMFRTAQSILHPSGGQTSGNVFKYVFGYKLENEYCYIRAMVSVDMYEGIKLEIDITGKENIVADLSLIINGNKAIDKDINICKNVRQEIIIPMKTTK